jgi:hypothetical protein
METILYNKVRKYIYDCLDEAIYACDEKCREWYITATYADCRQIFVSEIWAEDDSESYWGFNMISDKVRESDIDKEELENLFEEVKEELVNEHNIGKIYYAQETIGGWRQNAAYCGTYEQCQEWIADQNGGSWAIVPEDEYEVDYIE